MFLSPITTGGRPVPGSGTLVVVRVWVPVVDPAECTAVDPHAAANGETDATSAPQMIAALIDRLLVRSDRSRVDDDRLLARSDRPRPENDLDPGRMAGLRVCRLLEPIFERGEGLARDGAK